MDNVEKNQTVRSNATDGKMQRRKYALDGINEVIRHIPRDERLGAILHAATVFVTDNGRKGQYVEEVWAELSGAMT